MHFRSAVFADAAEIADFMTRNFLAAYGQSSSPENVQKAVHDYYDIEAQYVDLADNRIINCLCIINDKIVGLAQVKPPGAGADSYQYEISRFYVDTLYHGKGVAPALMDKMQEVMRTHSAKSLWLSVWQESQQAIRFYQKHGFVISGDTIFMLGDEAMNDWLMTKDL